MLDLTNDTPKIGGGSPPVRGSPVETGGSSPLCVCVCGEGGVYVWREVCVCERGCEERESENVSHDMDLSREFVCVAKTEREMLEH